MGWIHFSERDEPCDVRLENWALGPWPKRLIDVGIDTTWSDVPNKVSGCTVERINEQCRKHAATLLFARVLIFRRCCKDRHPICDLGYLLPWPSSSEA